MSIRRLEPRPCQAAHDLLRSGIGFGAVDTAVGHETAAAAERGTLRAWFNNAGILRTDQAWAHTDLKLLELFRRAGEKRRRRTGI
jgi:hypothetical protein